VKHRNYTHNARIGRLIEEPSAIAKYLECEILTCQ
jgi:hypothetical protein